ncbi:MAG: hypothetical protein CVT62_13255 [Actinobacteria bacterium HGW-Actinobacteria-2]|nr:MAG: hypothetical protein CVT62_13255 [Actinobacteria bacterium HGW-Actinobacteria-2]
MHRSTDPFEYVGYQVHPESSRLVCRYRIGAEEFVEEFGFPAGGDWGSDAAAEAARWLFLLAGVSYYKTSAPQVIDLGDVPVSDEDRAFLRDYYLHGLGEFAYRLREHHPDAFPDGLDLSDLALVGGRTPTRPATPPTPRTGRRPLIPFGGGLDSIVSVAMLAGRVDDPALFIVNRPGDRFEAIETPAAQTGLPIVRAERAIDPKVLQSRERGYLNGHVPVTGIISAMGVLAASLFGYDALVMSNEWSSSSATLTLSDGREVNHQYSKSADFERAFAARLQADGLPDYFSLLRPFTELWIARYFAEHAHDYLASFRSCNRSFAIDPTKRVDHWCGVCDKCAFIDLIVSPFVSTEAMSAVFGGNEPLQNPELASAFEQLMGLDTDLKPWECVGDVVESRVAMRLIAERDDRATALVEALSGRAAQFDDPAADALLVPVSDHGIPERYAALIDLG